MAYLLGVGGLVQVYGMELAFIKHLLYAAINQQAFIKRLLCTRHCAGCWAYEDKKRINPCPRGAYTLLQGKQHMTTCDGAW